MESKVKNYIQFLISVIIMGFGIALVTKSQLGTSAISSVPYVLSEIFNWSFGTFTFLVNVVYFVLQLVILKGNIPKHQYLQLLVGPILGVFIDLSMNTLSFIHNISYGQKLFVLILGCIVIGFSIWLQLKAKVVTNPNEGLIKALSETLNKDFSTVKTAFDVFLVVLAVSMSWIGLNKIVGVREGTLISAFGVGLVIKCIYYIQERLGKDA